MSETTPFPPRRTGILFVLSAPSGAGKSTLLHRLSPFGDFQYSVSCTTRAPRSGEVNGVDYHFLTRTEFEQEIATENLLEWAEVHGNYYGTRRSTLVDQLGEGIDILLDLDVQGAKSIRDCNDPAIATALADVFLTPPSIEILTHRLRSRGTETEEQVTLRLQNALRELECWRDYRYLVVSGSAEDDLLAFRSIMEAERMRTQRLVSAPPTP